MACGPEPSGVLFPRNEYVDTAWIVKTGTERRIKESQSLPSGRLFLLQIGRGPWWNPGIVP